MPFYLANATGFFPFTPLCIMSFAEAAEATPVVLQNFQPSRTALNLVAFCRHMFPFTQETFDISLTLGIIFTAVINNS
jgi:hypothetical protein